jgi:hypothetical protein
MSTVVILDPDPAVINALRVANTLLPAWMHSSDADALSVTIALQESRCTTRRQLIVKDGKLQPLGPAKGIHQGELGGGLCAGVPSHHATAAHAASVLAARGVANNPRAIWNALEHDDVLSFALARLLLFTDPAKIPSLCDVDGAWRYYLRTWRPGKPHFHTWGECHNAALRALGL